MLISQKIHICRNSPATPSDLGRHVWVAAMDQLPPTRCWSKECRYEPCPQTKNVILNLSQDQGVTYLGYFDFRYPNLLILQHV